METEAATSALFWLGALWGIASIALLISATRLCYRIEARSGRPLLKHGLPGYANVVPVAFNVRVARDDETLGAPAQVVQKSVAQSEPRKRGTAKRKTARRRSSSEQG